MCVHLITRGALFIGGPGYERNPSITPFPSLTNSFTLYGGITVTPRLAQASNVSLYGRKHLYMQRLLSLLRTAPLYTSSMLTCPGAPSDRATLPPTRHLRRRKRTTPTPRQDRASEAPRAIRLRLFAREHLTHGVSRPTFTFGAEGALHSEPPRIRTVPSKQHSPRSSNISVINKSLPHTQQNPITSNARSWHPETAVA
jgi:hypothetical protein